MRIKIPLIVTFFTLLVSSTLFGGGIFEQFTYRMIDAMTQQGENSKESVISQTENNKGVGTASITGKNSFFQKENGSFMSEDKNTPFFESANAISTPTTEQKSRALEAMPGRDDIGTGIEIGTAPGSGGSTTSGSGTADDEPEFYALSTGASAGIAYLFDATEPVNGIFSAAVDWAIIPHLGLGFKFGISPSASGSIAMMPEVSASYYFDSTGLQGLYTGATVGYSVSSMGGVIWFAPQIGYRLVLFDFLAIDGKFGYVVMPQVLYHGPMATISTGYSF